MWRNFQFSHNCHTWKAEISPYDDFLSNYNISDKYQACFCFKVFIAFIYQFFASQKYYIDFIPIEIILIPTRLGHSPKTD